MKLGFGPLCVLKEIASMQVAKRGEGRWPEMRALIGDDYVRQEIRDAQKKLQLARKQGKKELINYLRMRIAELHTELQKYFPLRPSNPMIRTQN